MVIDVDLTAQPAAVTLLDPDDVQAFAVRVRGGADPAHLAAAVEAAGAGRVEAEHVWVREAWLREQARGRVADGWEGAFAGMLAFAASKGWVGDDGSIRAHVETA